MEMPFGKTRADVFELIAEYKQHECLWNTTAPSYRRSDERIAAWEEIAQHFGISLKFAKKKIRSLRSAYNFEKKKVDESKNSGYIYKPTLFYYDKIKFVHDQPDAKLKDELIDESVMTDNEDSLKNECEEDDNEFNYGIETFAASPSSDTEMPPVKKQRKNTSSCSISNSLNTCNTNNNATDAAASDAASCSSKRMDNDIFMAFGNSIAKQLEKFPIIEVFELMNDIQNTLTKKAIEVLQRDA